jgi:hypothetical protein
MGIKIMAKFQIALLCILVMALMTSCEGLVTTAVPTSTAQTGGDNGQLTTPLENNPGPLSIYLDEGIPAAILPDLSAFTWITRSQERESASLVIHEASHAREGDYIYQNSLQVFALVAPFPTITDSISSDTLKAFWRGNDPSDQTLTRLFIDGETKQIISNLWGEPDPAQIVEISIGASLESLLAPIWYPTRWAIVPFEQLSPKWKVISVDGISPLDPAQDLRDYPLAISYQLSGKPDSEAAFQAHTDKPALGPGNRDPEKMTRVVMTGVTALVRATAGKMETEGLTYPARDIREWLRSADITHVSNEIAFIEGCPPPDPFTNSLMFCSDPKYIALLEDVGADVIEMTGNHMNDWYDRGPFLSLALYQARGWQSFGGGSDLADSQLPALYEHHGNKIAFIGCNDPGPDYAWATETRGGSAACEDYGWMKAAIQNLENDGYQVITTIQYHENYSYVADGPMRSLFRPLVESGAVIVQGSQAHTPKEMEFHAGGFIHYGLGNLFFDQMHVNQNGILISATRQEFIDRYTFYDNHLLSIELLTAMLEDYARPRPMTLDERRDLLNAVFSISIWD